MSDIYGPPMAQLRLPFVVVGDNGLVASYGHVPASVGAAGLAVMNATEVSEQVFRDIVALGGRCRLDDGRAVPVRLPPSAAGLRALRNKLLAASDWMQLTDVPASDAVRAARIAYRQALRDVPAQSGFPAEVYWPTPPG